MGSEAIKMIKERGEQRRQEIEAEESAAQIDDQLDEDLDWVPSRDSDKKSDSKDTEGKENDSYDSLEDK